MVGAPGAGKVAQIGFFAHVHSLVPPPARRFLALLLGAWPHSLILCHVHAFSLRWILVWSLGTGFSALGVDFLADCRAWLPRWHASRGFCPPLLAHVVP